MPMLDIVQTNLARRLWKISSYFKIPINDPRIQAMNEFDLAFYEYSMIADDPKLLDRLKNHFYDPEFDDWAEEFDKEQESDGKSVWDFSEYEVKPLDMPDKSMLEYVKSHQDQNCEDDDDFEDLSAVVSTDIDDWEVIQ